MYLVFPIIIITVFWCIIKTLNPAHFHPLLGDNCDLSYKVDLMAALSAQWLPAQSGADKVESNLISASLSNALHSEITTVLFIDVRAPHSFYLLTYSNLIYTTKKPLLWTKNVAVWQWRWQFYFHFVQSIVKEHCSHTLLKKYDQINVQYVFTVQIWLLIYPRHLKALCLIYYVCMSLATACVFVVWAEGHRFGVWN